ncbi:ester cyclase [Burkholderia cenocepacia]
MTDTDLATRYRAYIDCLNRQDWTALGEYVSDDVIHNDRPLGLAGYRAMLTMDVRLVELSDPWSHRKLTLCARSFDALPKYTREFVAFLSGGAPPR